MSSTKILCDDCGSDYCSDWSRDCQLCGACLCSDCASGCGGVKSDPSFCCDSHICYDCERKHPGWRCHECAEDDRRFLAAEAKRKAELTSAKPTKPLTAADKRKFAAGQQRIIAAKAADISDFFSQKR